MRVLVHVRTHGHTLVEPAFLCACVFVRIMLASIFCVGPGRCMFCCSLVHCP